MQDLLTPSDVEALAAKAGKTIPAVCAEANVAPSTFYRWKHGKSGLTLDVYRRLRDAVAPTPHPEPAQ